jgi:hypothetical protein
VIFRVVIAGLTFAWCGGAHAACPSDTTETLQMRGSTLCVVAPASSPARRALLRTWVQRSANIVADYYDEFPAPLVVIRLPTMEGAGVGGGRTVNEPPLVIRVRVGRDITSNTLADDWVLVHEMVHLALPELGAGHDWLAEGLAIYVEGVARAQAGNRSIRDVWAEDRRSMPNGLPHAGEGGMDETPTWARTYWGGALFCLQAEIAIREQTGNRVGLQTAVRAILRQTKGYGSERDIADVLRIGDEATGTHALRELYAAVKDTPQRPDLDMLWRRLGVPEDPATQAFDDHAPWAAVRIAITAPMR